MLFGLMILQVAALAPPARALPDAKLDLTDPTHARACPEAKPGEITVCGRNKDPDKYRLPTLPQIALPGPPTAEWGLGGGVKGGVGFAKREVGGIPSNAVMATIKIPF